MDEKHTSEKYRKKPVVIEAHQWNPRERRIALSEKQRQRKLRTVNKYDFD